MAVSTVHRERARKRELLEIKERIKNELPLLTKREIRRFRIPYHEALSMELDEDGFLESSLYLKMLINYQDTFRQRAGEESYQWFYPQLKFEKDKLDILYEGLRNAESAKQAEDYRTECRKILDLGIYFSKQKDCWKWLTRQLLAVATNTGKNCKDDGGRMEAVCRYVSGRHYMAPEDDELKEIAPAIEELKICRDKSAGRSKWNANEELGVQEDNLFIESCKLLYRAMLIFAKTIVDDDPMAAAKICQIAQNRAQDAHDQTGVSECLLQLGICERKGGNANTSLAKFNKVLSMSLEAKDPERICEARIQIALAHSRLGNLAESNAQLEALLQYAYDNHLHYYFAQAHRYLGEVYINRNPKLSTPLLIKAVEVFMDLNDKENVEQVKTLAAISAVQELLPHYVKLILSCENNIQKEQNLMKLVKWKDLRRPFWSDDSNIDLSLYCQGHIGEIYLCPDYEMAVESETRSAQSPMKGLSIDTSSDFTVDKALKKSASGSDEDLEDDDQDQDDDDDDDDLDQDENNDEP